MPAAHLAGQVRADIIKQVIDTTEFRVQCLMARARHQFAIDFRCVLGDIFGGLGELLHPIPRRRGITHHFQIALNHRQQIIEVMGYTANDPRHGFHPLGLAKALFSGRHLPSRRSFSKQRSSVARS